MNTKRNIVRVLLALAIGATAAIASPSFAAPRGGAHTKSSGDTGTFSLVLLDSTDGVAHYGQRVGFDVKTNAYTPVVTVDCYQDGALVYSHDVGYWPGYLWPQVFGLSSSRWTSGAADCNAVLVSWNAKMTRSTTLATMSFHVYA